MFNIILYAYAYQVNQNTVTLLLDLTTYYIIHSQ